MRDEGDYVRHTECVRSTWSNMAMRRWLRTGSIGHFIGGWRQMPIYGWMLPSAIGR
jgi:hypothetical protein